MDKPMTALAARGASALASNAAKGARLAKAAASLAVLCFVFVVADCGEVLGCSSHSTATYCLTYDGVTASCDFASFRQCMDTASGTAAVCVRDLTRADRPKPTTLFRSKH